MILAHYSESSPGRSLKVRESPARQQISCRVLSVAFFLSCQNGRQVTRRRDIQQLRRLLDWMLPQASLPMCWRWRNSKPRQRLEDMSRLGLAESPPARSCKAALRKLPHRRNSEVGPRCAHLRPQCSSSARSPAPCMLLLQSTGDAAAWGHCINKCPAIDSRSQVDWDVCQALPDIATSRLAGSLDTASVDLINKSFKSVTAEAKVYGVGVCVCVNR